MLLSQTNRRSYSCFGNASECMGKGQKNSKLVREQIINTRSRRVIKGSRPVAKLNRSSVPAQKYRKECLSLLYHNPVVAGVLIQGACLAVDWCANPGCMSSCWHICVCSVGVRVRFLSLICFFSLFIPGC